MSAFTANKGYRHVGGIDYISDEPVEWEIGAIGSNTWFAVAKGTRFNCSIPRALRWWLSPHDDRFLLPSLLHDEALRRGWRRWQAAGLFEDALHAKGVPSGTRLAMTLAVSLFRWS